MVCLSFGHLNVESLSRPRAVGIQHSQPVMTKNIGENDRKKILLLGRTGAGKSSLGNVLAGHPFDSDMFPVSASYMGCTQKVRFADEFLNGDMEKPISLIDTIGFEDPDHSLDDTDEKNGIISELVIRLRDYCNHINLFLLVISGDNPRMDKNLIEMIEIFEGMFGEGFWSQVVVVFTKLSMDERSQKKFKKTSGGKTYDEFAIDYHNGLQERFPSAVDFKYLLLDACYDDSYLDEKEAFNSAMDKLCEMLDQAPPLSTKEIQMVFTEKEELKNMLTEKDRMLDELTKMQIKTMETIEMQFQMYNSKLKDLKEKNKITEDEYEEYSSMGCLKRSSAMQDLTLAVDQQREEVITSKKKEFKFKTFLEHVGKFVERVLSGIIARLLTGLIIPDEFE